MAEIEAIRAVLAALRDDEPVTEKQLQDAWTEYDRVRVFGTIGQQDLRSRAVAICANCPVDTGRCPQCGIVWSREGDKRTGLVMAERCIGFGEQKGRCENVAGTPWTPLWCLPCDEARRASISASLAEISASFDPSGDQDAAGS